MVTVTHEVAQKVSCVVCGKEKFAMKAPYICHGCWKSGEAAQMIQRLTKRALDGVPPREAGDLTPDDVRKSMVWLLKPRRK